MDMEEGKEDLRKEEGEEEVMEPLLK